MPQTASMHELKNRTGAVIAKFKRGPVLILNRSTPQVVCVSLEQWNATVKHIA
jgi:prevent-host-death family protein